METLIWHRFSASLFAIICVNAGTKNKHVFIFSSILFPLHFSNSNLISNKVFSWKMTSEIILFLSLFVSKLRRLATINSNRTTARLTHPWDHLDQCFKNYPHKNLFQLGASCSGSNSGPITFQLCNLNLLTSALCILTSESTKWC